MTKFRIIFSALFLFFNICWSQSLSELYETSKKAYESKDYKLYLKYAITLDSLRPFHPTFSYNLASAHALNSNWEEAQVALRRLVLMDNTIDFESSSDFNALQEDEGYRMLLALKKAQSKPIETSKSVVALLEKELHPEGVLFLPKSKLWLASSVRKRKIVSFDLKTGICNDWLKDKSMLSVLAIKADAKEQYLWVTTVAFPEMEGYSINQKGHAVVLKIDIKSKKILSRFTLEGNHVFGDLVVSNDGIVYVSDSQNAILYKIENDTMSVFLSLKEQAFNLQGLTFNKDQSKLYTADYLKGICMIDVPSKSTKWLSFPDMATPKGIDGLVFYHNSLLAIQNGVKPIRITQFLLNEWQNEIESFKVLDNNRPEFNEPTLATLVGEKLYFFANSPWNAYNENGVLDDTKVKNPTLYSLKL